MRRHLATAGERLAVLEGDNGVPVGGYEVGHGRPERGGTRPALRNQGALGPQELSPASREIRFGTALGAIDLLPGKADARIGEIDGEATICPSPLTPAQAL